MKQNILRRLNITTFQSSRRALTSLLIIAVLTACSSVQNTAQTAPTTIPPTTTLTLTTAPATTVAPTATTPAAPATTKAPTTTVKPKTTTTTAPKTVATVASGLTAEQVVAKLKPATASAVYKLNRSKDGNKFVATLTTLEKKYAAYALDITFGGNPELITYVVLGRSFCVEYNGVYEPPMMEDRAC